MAALGRLHADGRIGGPTIRTSLDRAVTAATNGGLVVYRNSGDVDAIHEYSVRLVAALRAAGTPAHYVPDGPQAARRLKADFDWILLQYNPFSYGARGFSPGLLRDMTALRRSTTCPLALLVHENWVEMRDVRSAIMGAAQRLQLQFLLRLADRVIVTTESYGRAIRRPAVQIPVGSNITPLRIHRDEARERLGFGNEFVVALFGTGRPDRALDYAEAAIALLAAQRGTANLRVLNLGSGSPRLRLPPEIDVLTPGRLRSDDLSLRLHASDVMLLPLTEGVSCRRTTLMAGLAHCVPVVGLHGSATDRVFLERSDALKLTPGGDKKRFASAVAEVCANHEALRALGRRGHQLYRTTFDWPVVARRVRAAVTDTSDA